MVRLENLTKFFWANGQKKMVADDINITFPTGTAVGLLGRNGAGKTTLMEMIAGSIRPIAGGWLAMAQSPGQWGLAAVFTAN